jgi:F-type H+-transporting ATPase subunit delta
MKSVTIARNYAEALFEAANARGETERYGEFIDAVTGAVQSDPRIAAALDSPRVAKAAKGEILRNALKGLVPDEFVRFLEAVVRRGRQGLLGEIAVEYQRLLDTKLKRVHAGVTVAKDLDEGLEKDIVDRLARALGKEVRAHFQTDAAILGGVVVRVGDRVFDGSLRRRLTALRRRMLAAG